jgi:hypothetical protein
MVKNAGADDAAADDGDLDMRFHRSRSRYYFCGDG